MFRRSRTYLHRRWNARSCHRVPCAVEAVFVQSSDEQHARQPRELVRPAHVELAHRHGDGTTVGVVRAHYDRRRVQLRPLHRARHHRAGRTRSDVQRRLALRHRRRLRSVVDGGQSRAQRGDEVGLPRRHRRGPVLRHRVQPQGHALLVRGCPHAAQHRRSLAIEDASEVLLRLPTHAAVTYSMTPTHGATTRDQSPSTTPCVQHRQRYAITAPSPRRHQRRRRCQQGPSSARRQTRPTTCRARSTCHAAR
jgi:hypothetical protein